MSCLQYFLSNSITKKIKNICDIEKKIIEGEERSSKMSIEKTMHIKQSLKLGRQSYQLLKSCLSNGNNILPTWKELRSEEKKITPSVCHQKDPIVGVKFDYFEALNITIFRTLELIDVLPSTGSTLMIKVKDGV